MAELNKDRLPQHVAVIMDGNGRWAKARGLERIYGHYKGVESVRAVTTAAAEWGIRFLTLYAFSTENWNRPKAEVDALMELLIDTIAKETPTFMKNQVRLVSIGDISRLTEKAQRRLMECIEETSRNTGLTLVLALSYSSRWEMTAAMQQLAAEGVKDITEERISETINKVNKGLNGVELPDVDLLIRTSGELRISNFLLWQLAYAELYFTQTLWPDFDAEEFKKALLDYQGRERRFGKTSEQLKN